MLPKRTVERRVVVSFISSPGVIDKDIQFPLLYFNPLIESFDFFILSVIAIDGNASAARFRDNLGGLVNRQWTRRLCL